MHHVYDAQALREAYFNLKRDAAPGVDGQTWQEYGEHLDEHIADLSERLKRGAYRAKPVRRSFIPKADGRPRPLGVTALEDKVVQRAVVEVMNCIYETDFLGFSYGFRPGRRQHDALDALYVGVLRKKVNWVLDADIRGYFDAISHDRLMKLIERRIADQRILRLIQKWLSAGVLQDGEWKPSEVGTPQGGVISPILANIYLHYAFDLWAHEWRQRADDDVIIVRYADDFIVGFQFEWEAKRFLDDLRQRFVAFGLELHPEKTRLIEFGRYATRDRENRGLGKPETFDFLGFTHICGKTRSGKFTLTRKTIRKRLRAKLKALKIELKRRLHNPIPDVGKWLGSVVRGHLNYYAVPMNGVSLARFQHEAMRHWKRALSRRSQTGHITWERMRRIARRWLPPVRIMHPYPTERFRFTT